MDLGIDLFAIIIVCAVIFLIVLAFVNAAHKVKPSYYIECDWCGTDVGVSRKELKEIEKDDLPFFCSGRCKRAEEASRGVKEKRIRWIEGE